jgi:sulfofructose kinase
VRAFPGFDVDAVDTLGAGDVFHGAFALGLAEGRPVDEVIRWASAAAGLKCERRDTADGFPSRQDVASLMER